MDRERAAIIELFSNGKRPGEILKMLQICKSRRKIVYRTIQRYNKTGDIKDMPRSGQPKSVRTPRLKKIVMDKIRRNPQQSIRKMASELKVSLGSMQNLVRNDLHFRSFKRRTVHFLSERIIEKRLTRSKGLLSRLATQPVDQIVFSDEKLFTIEEATNKQNDRINCFSILKRHSCDKPTGFEKNCSHLLPYRFRPSYFCWRWSIFFHPLLRLLFCFRIIMVYPCFIPCKNI